MCAGDQPQVPRPNHPRSADASRASRVMRAQSPFSTASAGVSHEPPQTFTLGSTRNCGGVVGSAAKHGLRVLISISTPIPYWASQAPKRKNAVWMPDPEQLARFAYAVAARYGQYADQFAVLNEPNQGAWLQPQSLGGRSVSPHVYAALVRAGYPAIKMAAPKATVLVGE